MTYNRYDKGKQRQIYFNWKGVSHLHDQYYMSAQESLMKAN